jgi:hypothetical protein
MTDKTMKMGPWAGIDNVRRDDEDVFQLPGPREKRLANLISIVNMDQDESGWPFTTRDDWTLIDNASAHSLFEYSGISYAVLNNVLVQLNDTGVTNLADVSGPLSWTILNDEPVFTDGSIIRVIRNSSCIPLPSSISEADEQRVLDPLPGGTGIAYWNGRLLVVRGTTLFLSEPLRYGAYDTMRGRVQFGQQIQWIAAIQSGIYVGLTESIRFLDGTDPLAFTHKRASGPGWGGTVVDSAEMYLNELRAQENEGTKEIAVWMEEKGFVLGLPSGKVERPQAYNLKDLEIFHGGKISLYNSRLTAIRP